MSKKNNMTATTMKRILKMITIIENAEHHGWQNVKGYAVSSDINNDGNRIVRLWSNEEDIIDKVAIMSFNMTYVYTTDAAQQIVEFIY